MKEEPIEVQTAADIVGNTFMCLICGYREEISPTYPQREKDIMKSAEHECKRE